MLWQMRRDLITNCFVASALDDDVLINALDPLCPSLL